MDQHNGMEKREYAVILAHKSKNNTLFVIVKGLLLFVCTDNISKTFYKIYIIYIYFKYISNISLLFLPTHSWQASAYCVHLKQNSSAALTALAADAGH